ncbi:coiled-coil domain-containing protein MTMR15 [Rhizoctonia solani AG-1 IA]|uniref:Fanconi-associated nuclease n=1 Tax=Thanatephorus cucumeris (strain AG1-IA) TaxID=983506 RepID=L8X621_THACA|nr:coiled-coil domain-containing protein MTMR15 [Rhizoctonia solani AG-1 IA]
MRILAYRALTANQPETAKSRPPRVLVLGPENSGKTSACKIWCNYAIRGRSWCPTLVNLDVSWTIPGTVSACPLSSAIPTCTPANPFGATATSAPTALSSSALLPVVHWFGHSDAKRNQQLIEKLIRTLADGVKQKFQQDHTFVPVNTILVMGHDKLSVELQRVFGGSSGINVLKVPKSGGVTGLCISDEGDSVANPCILLWNSSVPSSFYESCDCSTWRGSDNGNDTVTLLNNFECNMLAVLVPSSALPIGATRAIGEIQPVRVDVESGGILHSVLALLAPFDSPPSDQMLLQQEVNGFLIVLLFTCSTAIDIPRRKITVLAPSQVSLVGRIGTVENHVIGPFDNAMDPIFQIATFNSPTLILSVSPGLIHETFASMLFFRVRRFPSHIGVNGVSITDFNTHRMGISILWSNQKRKTPHTIYRVPPIMTVNVRFKRTAQNATIEVIIPLTHHRPKFRRACMSLNYLMIDTVLEHESHLFNSSEIAILNDFQQYLISRLVQRKRGKWLRFDQLKESYASEFCKFVVEAEVPRTMADTLLDLSGYFHSKDSPPILSAQTDVIDLTLDSDDEDTCAPTLNTSGNPASGDGASALTTRVEPPPESVVFLEDTSAATPAQLLECLNIEELKLMGKRLKIPSKSKSTRDDLVKAILHSTSTQTTLPFATARKTSNPTSKRHANDWQALFPFKPPQVSGKVQNLPLQERRVREMCRELYGACFRLLEHVIQTLHLVSVVYFRSTEQSEANSIMLSAILSLAGKRNYPIYEYKRTADVFPARSDLLRYMEISLLLNEVENILAGAGQPQGAKFDRLKASQDVVDIWGSHSDRWNLLVAYLKDKSHRERGLERFEEGAHTNIHDVRRIVKAAECFGALKRYDMEAKLLAALLRQTRWRRSKRGRWYDRMALIYTKYMGGGEANLRQARDYLQIGLKDELVFIGSRPMLLRRLKRLEKQLRLPLEEQYVCEDDLKVAVEVQIEGSRVYTPQTSTSPSKNPESPPKISPSPMDKAIMMHFSGSPSSSLPITNNNQRSKWTGKSIWAGKEGEVNVETLALEYYAGLGFRGRFHSEGAIVSTLFGFLFWDILFAPIPGAFETPYQSAPLDLVHDSFFSSREELINTRLGELKNTASAARRIVQTVYSRERDREPWCIGVRWDLFEHENDLLEIVECLGGPALAAICRLLAEEYGSRRGGVPDLFVWNSAEKTCKFVEVKGPGDNLSETQKVWIDVLLGAGVDVELCRVYEYGKIPPRTVRNKNKTKEVSKRRPTSHKQSPEESKPAAEENDHKSNYDSEEMDEIQSSSEDQAGTNTGRDSTAHQDQDDITHIDRPSDPAVLSNICGLSLDKSSSSLVEPPKLFDEGEHTIYQTHHAHTTLLRPITSIPAPLLPTGSNKSNLENLCSTIAGVAKRARTLVQETVILEKPQTAQHQSSARDTTLSPALEPGPIQILESHRSHHSDTTLEVRIEPQFMERPMSSPQKRPMSSNKESQNVPKGTPAKKKVKEEEVSPSSHFSTASTPTPKRKYKRSMTHTPARRVVSTSAMADTTKERASDDDDSDKTTRTLRKRRRTMSERAGVSGSPIEWEKKWPEVFPHWVGDLGGSSDPDYEPSQ